MKRILMFIVITCIVVLSGCGKSEELVESIEPLENPEIELFSEFHNEELLLGDYNLGTTFIIYKRIKQEQHAFFLLPYALNDGYTLGAPHLYSYRILYNEEYYDLHQGYKLGLYTAEDLISYGIKGVTRNCSYDDSCK